MTTTLKSPRGCLGCNPKRMKAYFKAQGLGSGSVVEVKNPASHGDTRLPCFPCFRCGRSWATVKEPAKAKPRVIKNSVYLYDGRGTYHIKIPIPMEDGCASSKKATVVAYQIHPHLSKGNANALVKKLKASGYEVEYGERP